MPPRISQRRILLLALPLLLLVLARLRQQPLDRRGRRTEEREPFPDTEALGETVTTVILHGGVLYYNMS